MTRRPAHERARLGVGYAPEDAGIFPDLSVAENLQIGRWLAPGGGDAGGLDERIVALFPELEGLMARRGLNLSGGQKKLLELGRAMMADARVVLLDEPGAGVNRTLLAALAEDIKRLNRERGYTFCIIEHDMDFVAALCDPVIVMAEGRVLTQGSMSEIRANEAVLEAYLGGGAGHDIDAALRGRDGAA